MDPEKPTESEIIETTKFIKQQHEDDVPEKVLVEEPNKQGLKKDLKTIVLLMFLYFTQGLPLGLAGSMPFLLSSKKASFSDQGTYSFVFWPFSIKLLWAPIVDSIFFKRFGRRKSWLVPVQMLVGILMISLANTTENLLYNIQSHKEIIFLTLIFIMFTFLAATQDIAVDGWAITMLSKENVSWQSTCNGVGQTAGGLIGGTVFIVLESVKFSNDYIRPFFGLPSQTYGILSLRVFMYSIGAVFLVTSLLLAIFKSEKDGLADFDEKFNLLYSYKMILRLFKLKPIQVVAFVLLTVKIGFAAESLNFLKLIEKGVSKEKLSLLQIPLTPISVFWPLVISKWTNGPKPMTIFFNMIPFRLAFGIVIMVFIYFTPYFQDPVTNEFPLYYFMICLLVASLNSLIESTMFMAQLSFNAKIADDIIGGTYMTLLTTLGNLGGTYPSTISLFLVDLFSVKYCSYEAISYVDSNSTFTNFNQTVIDLILTNSCSSKKLIKECATLGGKCVTSVDAYYYLVLGFSILGLVWLIVFSRFLNILNNTPKSGWTLFKTNENGVSRLK